METSSRLPQPYQTAQPTRAEVDALAGPTLLEFGTDWCGYCMAAQPAVVQALQAYPGVRHIKAEDGPGRPLGRSFRVKLWPTLVLLQDGRELERLVRPSQPGPIAEALARQAGAAQPATGQP